MRRRVLSIGPAVLLLVGVAIPARGFAADATAAPAAPSEAPVLDKEKGALAVAAYRKYLGGLCAQLRSKEEPARQAKLEEVGLANVDDKALCAGKPTVEPLASGALLGSGHDEVLLTVWTGLSAQTGLSLAVMRDQGKGFVLVRHVLDAAIFEARLRLVAPGRRDVLVICEYRGLGGVYPGDCGFFGPGSFGTGTGNNVGDKAGALDETVELIELREGECGPFQRVNAGKVAAQGDRMTVELVLQKGEVVQGGREKFPASCSKRVTKSKRSFAIEYKFDGQSFHRVTPTPKAVEALLNQG